MRVFQTAAWNWAARCFGLELASHKPQRNHRFLEEALELTQSLGCTAAEAHMLVDYVFGRPVGEPRQEVGGVMMTLAVLCTANGLDLERAANDELARVWDKIEAIRAKQLSKPDDGPLPGTAPDPA